MYNVCWRVILSFCCFLCSYKDIMSMCLSSILLKSAVCLLLVVSDSISSSCLLKYVWPLFLRLISVCAMGNVTVFFDSCSFPPDVSSTLPWHSYRLMIFMTSYVLEYMWYSFAHCLHSFRLCDRQISYSIFPAGKVSNRRTDRLHSNPKRVV